MSPGEWQADPVSTDALDPGQAGPWRLLVTVGLLALALVAMRPEPGFQPTSAGRASLSRALRPDQPGWQMQMDLKGLGWTVEQAERALSELSGQQVKLADQSNQLLHLTQLEGQPLSVDPATRQVSRSDPDPVFGGKPSLVFEWSKRAFTLRGTLFRSTGTSRLLSGRLVGVLPFTGLAGSDEGFTLDQLGPLPGDLDRLLAIDPTTLRFLSTYRTPIQEQWNRWEFYPFKTLRTALGPALVYARWKGETLFCIGVKEPDTVTRAIEQRFPESVIRTAVRWSHGARLRGFDPDGPAWLLRGDHLLATPTGGTQRLDSALSAALEPRKPFARESSNLLTELARLAATEDGKWHLVVAVKDPQRGYQWGAVLRWTRRKGTGATGFLVVDPGWK
jgi:hypothetical protein